MDGNIDLNIIVMINLFHEEAIKAVNKQERVYGMVFVLVKDPCALHNYDQRK